jgi:hypothetical protein
MGSVHGDSGAPGVRVGLAECPHLRRPGRNQPFEKRPASCWLESFRIADRHVVQFVSQGRDLRANRVSGGQNEQTGDKEFEFHDGLSLIRPVPPAKLAPPRYSGFDLQRPFCSVLYFLVHSRRGFWRKNSPGITRGYLVFNGWGLNFKPGRGMGRR